MFSRAANLLPLALSATALICLIIVFVGCTSPSSPTSLYFMKVEFSSFPELGHLHLGRSLSSSLAGVAHKAGGVASHASNAAEHTANQVSNSLQDDLKLHLPAYYSIGLWGYCEGQQITAPPSNCSNPSVSFSFNLLKIFDSVSTQIEQLLPQGNYETLSGFRDVSKWSKSAYILGFIATALAVGFGITSIIVSWGKKLSIISSIVASIFLTGASIAMTVIYSLITASIQSVLQPLGVHASVGAPMFITTWLANPVAAVSNVGTDGRIEKGREELWKPYDKQTAKWPLDTV